MALKLKIPRRKGGAHGRLSDPLVKAGLAFFLICSAAFLAIFSYYYVTYSRIVDRRMRGHIFNNAARIYAAPETVRLGEKITPAEVADDLKRAGYTPEGAPGEQSPLGTYRVMGHGIEIKPGPQSYHNSEAAVIRDDDSGKVDRIASLASDRDLTAYDLEPQLVTALFDSEHRAKRRLISYDQIPKVMVDAVTAIEDRRFFQHSGVNFYRLFEAALVDLRERKHEQGGSTLTMQIARGFFLTPEKTYKRKATEILISVILEQRFSKQQIFELYANEVYMGQRGSFTINGFGEAARSYFNKDIRSITLPEAALLAGMIQRPSYLSPYKYPDRALERRNLVLDSMVETGAITREQADAAKATPLKLAPPNVEAYDAPYFVDLVKEQLSDRFKEQDLNDQAYRIYTTLDPGLQHDAAEAVEIGIKQVDAKINKLRTKRVKVGTGKSAKWETKVLPGPQAQVALIALDPRTGEVRALVGGRNYAWSQLNHAVAKRPTGSVFKPFVYAAAVDTGLTAVENAPPPTPPAPTTVAAATTTPIPPAAAAPASAGLFTPASVVDDSPTTFTYGDQIYEPRNYKEEYHGPVSLTYALAHSLNNATVKLAEEVGYDKVAALAKAAGITSVQATPAMALGAYDATPLEIAGAYTMFANQGTKVSPILLTSVRDARGGSLAEFKTDQKQVLDPRVAYVVTKMMEAVINTGTAAGVRGMGFSAPAAGKTGTSHDGWFAGYTSNLLCIVWVGYDDYSDIRLSGADTAAPIWAEFMKRAVERPAYRDVHEFAQPAGVVDVVLDKATNRLATPNCPDDYSAAFIAGTEPRDTCDHVATADQRGFFSRLLGLGQKPVPPPAVSNAQQQQQQPGVKPGGEQKKGFFGKIFGIFKGDDTSNKPENPTPAPPANSGSGQDPGNPPH